MMRTIEELGKRLVARGDMVGTAESCTGGLIGHLLTQVSGSSDWYLGGVVAYANRLKVGLLGVGEDVLAAHGAVSRETVEAMARGVVARIGAEYGVAVSGIAGPTGGSAEKPVGTVWIGWAGPGGVRSERFLFPGDRSAVKEQAAEAAIRGLAGLVIEGGGA